MVRIIIAFLLLSVGASAQTVAKGGTIIPAGSYRHSGSVTPIGSVVFSPSPGSCTSPCNVTLTPLVSGATVFYTTDGSTPTTLSTQYTGVPISITSNTTIKAISANIFKQFQNTNQNTNISGTPHWKPWCYLPNCNPGGNGTPQATNQTWGITSPVMSGAGTSMLLQITTDATVHQTNTLKTFSTDTCTTLSKCTYYAHDFWIYIPTADFAILSESEHDQYNFDNTDGIRWMFGMQWVKGGQWQFVGNSNVSWTNSGVTQALIANQWNHVQLLTHVVPAEMTTKPCKDKNGVFWACLYYDQLNINGTVHAVNQAYASNADPSGWSGTGMQHQQDIYSTNVTYHEYYSNDNFLITDTPAAESDGAYVPH